MQGIKVASWIRVLAGVWLVFLLGLALWHALGMDFWIADALFQFEGQTWAWRSGFVTRDLIHQFGGVVVRLLGLMLAIKVLRTWLRGATLEQILPLFYLLLSVGLSALTVILLKKNINIDCPWALLRYAGSRPFVGLLEFAPVDGATSGCFPAGHASAGYAWIALFYFYRFTRPRWKWWGLGVGLITGLVFGISQQFRGAHFASHDLWTIMICWSFAYSLDAMMLGQAGRSGVVDRRFSRWSSRLREALLWRPELGPEALLLITATVLMVFYNNTFWQALLIGRDWYAVRSWLYGGGVALTLISLHFLLLQCLTLRRTVKVWCMLLVILAAISSYFSTNFGTYFDRSMLDNILATDRRETLELIHARFLWYLVVYAALPIWIIARVRLPATTMRRSIKRRAQYVAVVFLCLLVGAGLSIKDLVPSMRNQPQLRYYIGPGNILVSLLRVIHASSASPTGERIPLEFDAIAELETDRAPILLVVVVGETVRAANWGLNGYQRQTTPGLAQRDVVNFPSVKACGTSTSVSLPCMFSPWGSHSDYDRDRVRRHESLLDVLANAGFDVLWLDNQSGCKGVCDGVTSVSIAAQDHSMEGCSQDRCLDGVLLEDLKRRLGTTRGDTVVVLHQMGNHGPAYYLRYPAAAAVYQPACNSSDFSRCTRQQVVNSYDNGIRYTDTFLSQTIDFLDGLKSYTPSLLYISDHGESLGEHGLYLHGLPYAIAPAEQTEVPMILWLSSRYAATMGIEVACLKQSASEPASQANLFHTVLGLLRVSTSVRDSALDITAPCVLQS